MRIATSVELVGNPDDVFEMRITEEFQNAKCAASRALSYTVAISERGDRTIIQTSRVMSTQGFPETARSIVGTELTINETQDWGPPGADGSYVAKLTADITGVPMSMTGSVRVDPTETGSRQILEADLKANIPLIGGKIEKLAMPVVEAGFDVEALILSEWLFD
ncbi:MAG: DUF2505 domain-containing protein [Tetrasphaera sp.]